MKSLIPVCFCLCSLCSMAQINTIMPQEAKTFYTKAMPTIKPQIKELIEKNAVALKGKTINIDSLCKELSKSQLLKKATRQDIEAIGVLIMVQATRDADEDLKNLVINKRNNAPSDNNNQVDSILENKSKMAENASELMKRISGAQDLVINNLK